MRTDRRSLLKGIAAAAALGAVPATSEARERRKAPADAVGLLYDSTKCIGCKACVVRCKERAGLAADTDGFGEGLYDAPEGLNQYTRTVIQLYKEGNEAAYVKKQCMHCIDPACVNACMLGSLQKGKWGAVTWRGDRCVGCRYCQVACSFNVPQFEWSKANPKLVKCDLCADRLDEGKEPACTDGCPRNAVIFGKREDLLREAHRRIAEKPDLYVDHVYGEKEVGGTQVLYLSSVEFEKLGFRFSHEEPVPDLQQTVQGGLYLGVVAPLALLGGLIGAIRMRKQKASAEGEEQP